MSEPNYDAMLWAAADRYMSGNGTPEGEVTFAIERDVRDLPEILRVLACLRDVECCELEVYCECGDADAVAVAVLGYDKESQRRTRHATPHITIPLTQHETEWTYEVAISAEERRRDAYEADAYDRSRDR